MDHKRFFILDVPVDNVTLSEATERMHELACDQDKQHLVTTPNPEMIVAAARDPEFKRILTSASLALPDGAGIVWAARHAGVPLQERVAGVDAMETYCMSGEPTSVFLLGAREGVAKRAAEVLRASHPALQIVGTHAGSPDPSHDDDTCRRINESQARALFVAYGAPAQEKWIDRNLPRLPDVRMAMGVGGSFDFIAGDVQRAPQIFRRLHLEWSWRLLLQPWRIKRIITATVVFPWMFLTRSEVGEPALP